MKEEGRNCHLRVPGKAAVLGESGEGQMCGQGMSGGSTGGPMRLVTRPLMNCLNFVAMLFSVVLNDRAQVCYFLKRYSAPQA